MTREQVQERMELEFWAGLMAREYAMSNTHFTHDTKRDYHFRNGAVRITISKKAMKERRAESIKEG